MHRRLLFICLICLPLAEASRAAETSSSSHWAFQAVANPAVPEISNSSGNPIDAFVQAKLQSVGLRSSPAADRRTLVRRLHYTLTGLPPSFDEVRRFEEDSKPKAYERLVDSLLDSPHYGEHWGRHWLDVARYSDTKGYVYGREERFWTHAWTYRDWVVKSLNSDMAYDRFLLLQLAADQVEDRQAGDEAAMGFLTLGRRFLGVKRDIIDDRIDVVTRGTMGLTVSCARCHDHKYDPIPTADYYSLFGVFDSSAEKRVSLGGFKIGGEAFQAELKKRRTKLAEAYEYHQKAASDRARKRTGDYLFAQFELHKYPANGFDQILRKADMIPAFVRKWERYLGRAKEKKDPRFVHWHAYASISATNFAKEALFVSRRLAQDTNVHPAVAKAFVSPPANFRELADRYAEVLASDELKQLLHGPDAPCEVPELPVVHSEVYYSSGEIENLYKLQGEVDRWIVRSKVEAPQALMMVDLPRAKNTRVYLRGDPLTLGDETPRQFLGMLSGKNRQPFKSGSGRFELAKAIIDPANPLTARVMVNRVWMHHFGEGLVDTPSDFGTRAEVPSHPKLLDWMTTQFIKDGWSLKKLHRRILNSATFRQSSLGDASTKANELKKDPANRLLWRMNQKRLTFEALRDSMIVASGELEARLGGKPNDIFKTPYPNRRTIYGLIDRQFFPSTLRMFDVATPDLHMPKRPETTVPQQALFFMNAPFVLHRTRAIAASDKTGKGIRIHALFRGILQRDPSWMEIAESLQLIDAVGPETKIEKRLTVNEWQYGFGELDEKRKSLKSFTPLPHFTGDAWQGGERWPDAKLGWVQLHATGGHPGNNRSVAAVRRWTAPRDMTINVHSKVKHEAEPGDGIRAFMVTSASASISIAKLHQQEKEMKLDGLKVEKGDTVDFVVDIDKVLNSDQYLRWSTIIEQGGQGMVWDSAKDFTPNESQLLNGWEQLAQALLCSNEFMFVD